MYHNYWTARTNRTFQTAQDLWECCCEYFQHVDDNPAVEDRVSGSFEGEAIHTNVYKKRPYTIGGLQLFLGIAEQTWYEYGKREEFAPIVEHVTKICYEQKYDGAVTGFFNANIVTRDLGLVDKTETKTDLTVNDGLKEQADLFASTIATLAEKVAKHDG